MARYWWQCTACGDRPAWLTVCHSRSLAAFIWDELAPSGWDQRLLRRRCKCQSRSLRITYRLHRGDPERVSVKHIVGLGPDGDYLAMLWDTFRHSKPRTHWMDFKYQRGRSPWGLSQRLVLEKAQLVRLLQAYEHATGQAIAAAGPAGQRGRRTEKKRSTLAEERGSPNKPKPRARAPSRPGW